MVYGKVCAPSVAKAVHRLRAEGKKLKEVASYFGYGEEWARRILLNYHGETGEPLTAPGNPGRPRKTTLEQDEKMIGFVQGDGVKPSSGQIASAMKESGMEISSSTIRRRLRDSKMSQAKVRGLIKGAARKKAATKLLAKEGLPVNSSSVRGAIKDIQEKNKQLSSRISKKKERKIIKSQIRAEKAAKQIANQMDTLPAPGTSHSKPSTSSTDVEMRS